MLYYYYYSLTNTAYYGSGGACGLFANDWTEQYVGNDLSEFKRFDLFGFLVSVAEEGSRKVFVYVDIPELKVKRSFPNFTKQVPINADEITVDFQAQ